MVIGDGETVAEQGLKMAAWLSWKIQQANHHWWLVRATYVVDGLFFWSLFLEGGGDCTHTR